MTTPAQKFSIPASFEKLRREVRAKGALYEDPEFPAVDSSVFRKERPPTYPFTWVRPHQVAAGFGMQPHLFVDSTSRFDLEQGALGNCWVVASLAAISDHRSMVDRVVPKGQTFSPDWYAGCFVFRFWFFGKWTEVVVDDRLPYFNGNLIFIHSHQKNEFWGALVEKAYAKLVGGYENLKSGLIADALNDLTSGLTESIPLRDPKKMPPDLMTVLLKSFERESLVGAGIEVRAGGVQKLTGSIQANGLVSGHAYTVSDVRKLRLADQSGNQRAFILVRVRNPWGDGTEWNGAWSDNSPEWATIPENKRQEIGLVKKDDGEFWMDWKDFLANFDRLDICHLPPSLSILSAKRWKCVQYSGEWVKGDTAGGREFLQATHWKNPQYKVRLRDSDDDDNDTCTMLVAVMQEDARRMHKPQTNIGFFIYKASPKYKVPYPKEFFDYNRSVGKVPNFSTIREVVWRFELDPGDYIVVPCTYDANVSGKFLLRIFFENAGSDVNESTTEEDAVDTPDGAKASESSRAPKTSSQSSARSAKAASLPGDSVSNGVGSEAAVDKSNEPLKQLFFDTAGAQFNLDAYQLASIFNRTEPAFQKWPLTPEAAKSLVSLVDCDETFRVSWNECEYIVHYVRAWLRAFVSMDSDARGSIPSLTLREAVAGMGYRVPDSLTRRFMHRFSDSDNRIALSSFISCMAFIVKVMTIFNENSKKGVARLTLDEFFRVGLVI